MCDHSVFKATPGVVLGPVKPANIKPENPDGPTAKHAFSSVYNITSKRDDAEVS